MPYYHDLVTQKSWEELQRLRRLMDFVLIGGWAAYFYTRALKAIREEVQIDVYLPHYSKLGIDASLLQTQTRSQEGFTLLDPNYLMALKIHTLAHRARSPKGEKDLIDILALVNSGQVDLSKPPFEKIRRRRAGSPAMYRIVQAERRPYRG